MWQIQAQTKKMENGGSDMGPYFFFLWKLPWKAGVTPAEICV